MLVQPDVLQSHISDILDIITTQLGNGQTSEREIRRAINYGHDRFISVAFPDPDRDPPCRIVHSPPPSAATGSGTAELFDSVHPLPAAVSIGCVFNSSKLASHLNIPANEYPVALANADPVGVLRGIAVHEDAEGHGILTETVKHTLTVLEQEGCHVQTALAWRGDDGVRFYNLFKEHGFSLQREFTEYWVEESQKEGYICPECGHPPCQCSALLFVRV